VTSASDIAIVGAGAAGLATAIFIRRLDSGAQVTLLETARLPGAKIVISGGGRCNVTNATVTERDFWGGSRSVIRQVLRKWPVGHTVAFFEGLGVPLKEESGGKLFPVSNRSRDVSEALLREAVRSGVCLETGTRVLSVSRSDGGFRLESAGASFNATTVVLATGGQSLPKTGSDGGGYGIARSFGHSIVSTTPALVPLVLDASVESPHRALAGVSLDVVLSFWIDGKLAERLDGALLWTHFGVSGPVVLNASRHWERAAVEARRASMTVNFMGVAFGEVERRLIDIAAERPRATLQSAFAGLLPASFAGRLLDVLSLQREAPMAHLSRDDRRRLAHALTEWPLAITASRGYNFAEATAGGVPLDEIRWATMESRLCPGLYLAGEILDVDGRIGGFNFQWAWASARVAAEAIASRGRSGLTDAAR
jgi:predicted Rossmann fold flavoprotein